LSARRLGLRQAASQLESKEDARHGASLRQSKDMPKSVSPSVTGQEPNGREKLKC
jgi:hypothetical protein